VKEVGELKASARRLALVAPVGRAWRGDDACHPTFRAARNITTIRFDDRPHNRAGLTYIVVACADSRGPSASCRRLRGAWCAPQRRRATRRYCLSERRLRLGRILDTLPERLDLAQSQGMSFEEIFSHTVSQSASRGGR
jgi:hypothetical protein